MRVDFNEYYVKRIETRYCLDIDDILNLVNKIMEQRRDEELDYIDLPICRDDITFYTEGTLEENNLVLTIEFTVDKY